VEPALTTIDGNLAANTPWFARVTWRTTTLLVMAVLLLRIVYLVWLCPFELAGDEAHYWEWSRHLDWSYYTKGPGVAWLIWASTALFGATEWSVRLPAAFMAALATIVLARMAVHMSNGDQRLGFLTAVAYTVLPSFHGSGQFMTIDSPFYTFWIISCYLVWRAVEAADAGRSARWYWIGMGLALGAGFLCKYTILLLVPGLIIFFLLRRRFGQRPVAGGDLLLAMVMFIIASSPVLIWNHIHGWPTVSHLLGHMRITGGDIRPTAFWYYDPRWTLTYLVGPFITLGPVGGWLLYRKIDRLLHDAGWLRRYQAAHLFLVCCAVPLLLFYLVISFVTDVELNWPVAAYTTMIILILPGLRGASSDPNPHHTERHAHWLIVTSVIIAAAISFAGWAVRIAVDSGQPALAKPATRTLARIYGHRILAREVEDRIAWMRTTSGGKEPFIIGQNYGTASLLAFYMRGQPRIYCSNHVMGGRKTAYDYFADTDLTDPALRGLPAIAVGSQLVIWWMCFNFDQIKPSDNKLGIFLIWGYKGTKPFPPASGKSGK